MQEPLQTVLLGQTVLLAVEQISMVSRLTHEAVGVARAVSLRLILAVAVGVAILVKVAALRVLLLARLAQTAVLLVVQVAAAVLSLPF